MSKIYSDLANAIAAYMLRDATVFVVNSQDLLLLAVNNAKDYCQRAVEFEYARCAATLPSVSLADGALLSTAVRFGTTDAVTVRNIEQVWLNFNDASAGQFPIGFETRSTYAKRAQRRFENNAAADPTGTALLSVMQCLPLRLAQVGQRIYLSPANSTIFAGASTVPVYLDIVEWLPDFSVANITGDTSSTQTNKLIDATKNFITLGVKVGDVAKNTNSNATAAITAVTATTLTLAADILQDTPSSYSISHGVQTSFLLDYCFQFMLLRSMVELNFFLKEDQRVQISSSALADSWNNVIQWNATIIGSNVDDANLD